MSNRSCSYPEHHVKRGSGLLAVAVAVLLAVKFRHVLLELAVWAAVVVGLAVVAAVVVLAVRLARCHQTANLPLGRVRQLTHPPKWLRHVPRAAWAACTWRWLCRNTGLSRPDPHRQGRVRRPRARVRPTAHGISVSVRARPGASREDVEKVLPYFADHWKVSLATVSQPRPGRLRVVGHVHDPLLAPLTLADAPPADLPHCVWLGRDGYGQDRWLDLRNISGICVGGQPGGGKSQAITSWETQLVPSPAVQFANVDGKGAGEFDDFGPRAWITAGDDMDRMLDVLEKLTGLMYDRLATVRDFTGGRKNIWDVGVSEAWPLQFSVFDETQSFFDLPAARALGKEQEKACAQAIKLGSELVRKGRSVGLTSVFSTQKPTSDSLPSAISSNCALSVAFSLKTLDAAKATLGPDIGNYESLSPVALSLPEYAGVCVVSLRDGLSPFTRLRSPLVTEDQAAAAASASAHLRKDPRTTLPVVVPDDARELAVP